MQRAARRGAQGVALLLPITVALVYCERLRPAFSVPKTAVFAIASFALAALALVAVPSWKRPRRERWFWGILIAFAAIWLVSAWVSAYRWASSESLCLLVGGVLLVASRAALNGEETAEDGLRLWRAVAAAGVAQAAVVWLQWSGVKLTGTLGFWAGTAERMRLFGTLGNPDFVATFLAAAMPATVALSFRAGRGRVLWLAAALAMGSAAVLTGARGGVLAMGCGTLLTVWLLARRRRAVALAALVLAMALAAGCAVNPRGAGESWQGRAQLWRIALHRSLQSPLGVGPGSFAAEYPVRLGRVVRESAEGWRPRLAGLERHAQNEFVEAWHDCGWLGAAAPVALLASWFSLAIGQWRKSGVEERFGLAVSLGMVVAVCVASVFDFALHRAESWTLFCLALSGGLRAEPSAVGLRRGGLALRVGGAVALLGVGVWAAWAPLAAAAAVVTGERAEEAGDLGAARQAYDRALGWQPASPDANFNRTRVLAQTGEFAAALAQSIRAESYVNEPELYLLRARIFEGEERGPEAIGTVRQGLQRFPYSAELREEAIWLEQLEADGQDGRVKK